MIKWQHYVFNRPAENAVGFEIVREQCGVHAVENINVHGLENLPAMAGAVLHSPAGRRSSLRAHPHADHVTAFKGETPGGLWRLELQERHSPRCESDKFET